MSFNTLRLTSTSASPAPCSFSSFLCSIHCHPSVCEASRRLGLTRDALGRAKVVKAQGLAHGNVKGAVSLQQAGIFDVPAANDTVVYTASVSARLQRTIHLIFPS